MFSPVTLNAVGFPSSWTSDKDFSEKAVQASITTDEKGNQSKSNASAEVQTENVIQTFSNAEYDTDKLSTFLSKVTPSVLDELDKIERSKAFTFHQTSNKSDGFEEVKELYKLSSKDPSKLNHMTVTNVQWSCTGNVIAVSFGSNHHPEWCSHQAAVYFYNINKYDFDGSTPSQMITTKSCVTAMAYHPYEPSVVAVGTYNGEVLIWNLQREGEELNFENSIFHQDKVTSMMWVTIKSQIFLFTSSLDGFIFSFKVSPHLGSVILSERFAFPEISDSFKMGILSFSFSHGQQGVFVAGLEGGHLFHCSVFAASTSRPGSASGIKDPTVGKLRTQSGPVISVSFSKYVHHIFATATAEKKFVVHSLNEVSPLFEIWADFEITGIDWSCTQASILFVWGLSNDVLAYDGNKGKFLRKLETKRSSTEVKNISVTSCNSKSPKLLAVGCGKGDAFIWEVPRYFMDC